MCRRAEGGVPASSLTDLSVERGHFPSAVGAGKEQGEQRQCSTRAGRRECPSSLTHAQDSLSAAQFLPKVTFSSKSQKLQNVPLPSTLSTSQQWAPSLGSSREGERSSEWGKGCEWPLRFLASCSPGSGGGGAQLCSGLTARSVLGGSHTMLWVSCAQPRAGQAP